MALVISATCPRCDKAHSVVGMRGPCVELCGACRKHDAMKEIEVAKGAAYTAARHTAHGARDFGIAVLEQAEHKVMIRMLCTGDTELQTLRNIRRYWDAVKAEVES